MAKDSPRKFDDISWLAIKNGDPDRIVKLLKLFDPVETTWELGLSAVEGDYWDLSPGSPHLSRVYITPLVENWRLVIGGWFYSGPEDDLEEGCRSHKTVARECKKLSKVFDETHAFTTQGRMDVYAYILARAGKIYREYLWDDGPVINKGDLTGAEAELRDAFVGDEEEGETWHPGMAEVMAVAGEVAINPWKLGRKTKAEGRGYLAVTAYGRDHGVPVREL